MRLPFVSAATYDWAIRAAEREADASHALAKQLAVEINRGDALFTANKELLDIIVAMKRENFVVDIPVTNTALSVDEADEYSVADESAQSALLKRKRGS